MIRIRADTNKAQEMENEQHSGNIQIKMRTPNESCAEMVEVIFSKIIDILDKDKSIGGLQKAVILKTAESSKEPIKKYILKLDEAEAQDIINRVKVVLL